jgi:UDP-N-acetylmuramoylalanine--D-glutamate ligase
VSDSLEGRKVLVVGAGVAGSAAARVLVGEGADVSISEKRPADRVENLAQLGALGIEVSAGGHEESHLDGATLVVTSPGVPPEAPIIVRAQELGIPVWGELELGARLCQVPFLAVTGTNGKTTTTGMIAACLRAAGTDAVACGNIGHPFTIAALEGHDALVVEASSFQLRFVETFHPRVSVLLNLSPDHLDWHGSDDAYADAKAAVFGAQMFDDVHVGNRDDARSAAMSSGAPARLVWFRLGEPDDGEVGYRDGELIARLDGEVSIGSVDGERAGYRADAAAAAAAALAFGVNAEAVGRGLAGFTPEHHRGEVVAVIDGVRFIDNSKATNVHAALAAIDGVTNAVLVAGGRAKGVDLSPLATRAGRLRAVVAIGESADALVEMFEGSVPVRRAESIEDAARVALDLAARPGSVLLAPACASWDMFVDYEERGDRFAAAARALDEEVGARG